MGKELPALHGDDHLPWGPDPIPGLSLLKELTSDDGSVLITNPSGPIADLSVVFPTGEVEYLTTSDSLATGPSGNVPWTHTGGATLTDLTTPALPSLLSDGAYLLMWVGVYSSMTNGFGVDSKLTLGLSWSVQEQAFRYASTGERNRLHMTIPALCTAGETVALEHTNADSATIAVTGSAVLVKLAD